MKRLLWTLSLIVLCIPSAFIPSLAGGKIYFVLGSDTAIWEGMNTNRFHCTYPLSLYTDPARNGYRVMDEAFRDRLRDSNGTPVKFTWWMMAGNIFRYATNTDVPVPNIMTMYLMQKYHGEAIRRFGDELTLHYHTFAWTDYNGDGTYWWDQALTFTECSDDFDFTLAQFLLEENVYPVSFRSGWHFMDNDWQARLDEILPYSMHNAWPSRKLRTTEPDANVIDWSRAPNTWIPYHPDPNDYQVPGPGRGWNLRSRHIGSVDSLLMDRIFASADSGITQVPCLWGHLPETDFLDNIEKIDRLAHAAAARYPNVTFEYCTAIEAMQKWLKTADTTAPVITLRENASGDDLTFTITTDEPIFQQQPFVAVKDRYERYQLLPCTPTGTNEWTTAQAVDRKLAAKIGVAVTDTVGNLTTAFRTYLPDDLFVDNEEAGYEEVNGTWTTITPPAWGKTARSASVAPGDTAIVRWHLALTDTGLYNLYVQIPPATAPIARSSFRLLRNGLPADTVSFTSPLPAKTWNHLLTARLDPAEQPSLEFLAIGSGTSSLTASADVVRCTPLVRERELTVNPATLTLGEVSRGDTTAVRLRLANSGISDLVIQDISTRHQWVSIRETFPLTIPPMSHREVLISLAPTATGRFSDSLLVLSDDPVHPLLNVAVNAQVLLPFRVVDNEDSGSYSEVGAWHYSVAQAYGLTSRYAFLSAGTGISATFRLTAPLTGTFDILEIVPKTVNSADKALYVIRAGGVPVDSVIVDQNAGSGAWVPIGRYDFTAGTVVDVSVHNTGKNTAGDVLRADAVKLQNVDPTASPVPEHGPPIPSSVVLAQNYPNPFNPTTMSTFSLPAESDVSLRVYDNLGREVLRLLDGRRQAGTYSVTVDAGGLQSGVYYYRLTAGASVETRRMILLR